MISIRALNLFDELLICSPEQRQQRLASLQRDDPELAQMLERMLAADAGAEGLLDRELTEALPAPAPAMDRSGEQIGPFRLGARLGRGGMGEVYEGRRPGSDFEQRVAVKLLRRGLDSDDIVRRFLRERRILAQLEHPNIARLIDGGFSADGLPYLVMEFVEGRSLIDAANAADLDLSARLNLFLQICDAVAYAHRCLIVHRDLKPSNVLLTAARQPKLLDFGIAKLLDEVDDEPLTGTGARVLTPAYAAPEQILGQSVSTATDVYALGLILYELLTGASAHQRQGKDLDRLSRDLEQESVTRPSAALLNAAASGHSTQSQRLRLARQLTGDIDTIVLHALKREPERRYQGAAELADDIRRHINGHPVRAQIDTLSYRMAKFVRRHSGGVSAAALAVLGVVAGLLVALWQADVARDQAARADAEARRATLQASRAESVKDFVLALFQEQNPLTRDQARAATAGELIERGIATAQSQFATDIDTQAQIIGELAELQFGLGDVQQSLPNLQTALALHERAGGKQSVAYASTLSALGGALLTQGETEGATAAIESALATLQELTGVDSIESANAEKQLLRLLLRGGQLAQALPIAQHVHQVYQRERGAQHIQSLQALYNIGAVLSQLDRLDEAEQAYRQVIAAYDSAAQSDHAAQVYPRLALARTLKERQQYAEAATVFASALSSATKALDAEHPLIGQILLHQGDLLRRMHRYNEAEQAWQSAEQIFAKQGMSAELGGLGIYRGALAMQQQQFVTAIAHYEGALARFQEAMGADNTFSYSAALRLAKARAAAGQTERALQDGRAAHEAMKAIAEPGSFDQSHAHEAWAEVLFEASQWSEAEVQYRQALAVHIAINGSDTIDTAVVAWQIAETLYAQNRADDESLALLDQAIKVMRKNDANDASLGEALLLRGKLLQRQQEPEAAVRDWRAAQPILLAAYGAQDRRVLEIGALLAP